MSWRSFKQEITVLTLFLVVWGLYNIFDISCLFYELTSIPCPTCYMTSALLSLFKGDIYAYMHYNAMALPVAFIFVGELFNNLFGKHKKILHCLCVIVLGINLFYYIDRFDLIDLFVHKIAQ